MARETRTRPYDVPPDPAIGSPDPPPAASDLTPAEKHAMRRSAPLTPAQFQEARRLAARGINPLHRL